MGQFSIKPPTEEELREAEQNYEKWLLGNPNNFYIWYSAIKDIVTETVRIPRSEIVPVKMEVRKSFFMDHPEEDAERIDRFVDTVLVPEIKKFAGDAKRVFIKNGCYSGKFNFRNSCLLEDFTKETVKKHIMKIENNSLCFDIGGDCEFVIREYLEPEPGTPEIYNGMPLRPEMRMFYDFNSKKILYKVFYLEKEYCRDRIFEMNENDGKVYDDNYDSIFAEYERLSEKHYDAISEALSKVNGLSRIWSVDFILEEDCVWLIDMAIGPESAYWKPEFEQLNKEENESNIDIQGTKREED